MTCDMIKRLTDWQNEQKRPKSEDENYVYTEPEIKAENDAVKARLACMNKDLDKAYAKWRHHPLLRNVPEKDARTVSLILDNQSLFDCGEFRPLGMELVSRVFQNFVPFDLVSVQPIRAPADNIFFSRFRYTAPPRKEGEGELPLAGYYEAVDQQLPEVWLGIVSEDITAKTRKVASYTDDVKSMDKVHPTLLAEKIRDEITHEILTDLWRNVGTVSKRQIKVEELDWEKVYIDVVCMSGVIHRKTLRGGTDWLVASPAIAKLAYKSLFQPPIDIDSIREVTRLGTMNARWKFFVDPKMEGYKLLCGAYNPTQMYAGYIYSPYVFAGPTPGGAELGIPSSLPGVITRYGKKLTREGGKYFGKIEYEITSGQG